MNAIIHFIVSFITACLRPLLGHRLGAEDMRVLALLRRLLSRHRAAVAVSFVTTIFVGVLEGASMALVTLAIQVLMAADSTNPAVQLSSLQMFIDVFGVGFDRELLGLSLLGAAVACQLLRSGLQFCNDSVAAYLNAAVVQDVRSRLFRRFLGMSFTEFGEHKTGQLRAYFDHGAFAGITVQTLISLLSILSITATYIGVLLWISPTVTFVVVFLIVGLCFPVVFVLRRVRNAGRHFVDAWIRLSESAVEFLQGFRLVHTFGLKQHALQQVDGNLNSAAQAYRRGLIWHASIRPLFESSSFLVGMTFLVVGFFLTKQSGGDFASVIAYALVLYRLIPQIIQANLFVSSAASTWPAMQRLATLLEDGEHRHLPQVRRDPPEFVQGIRFDDVSFQYINSNDFAVQGLNLEFPKGSMTAIVGASGAGKSTIVNLLLRFYETNGGKIYVDDVDLAEIDPPAWHKRIGLVDQDGFLFQGSVRDNIQYGDLTASEDDIFQAASIAGAAEFIQQLPQGYDTMVGERGHRLSGGQRQRLAIARAVVRNPQILILDEATSHLDMQSEQMIQQSIERLRRDGTIICIAHRLSTIVKADNIYVLDGGRVVEQGSHAELLEQDGKYAHLWRLQFRGDAASDERQVA